MRKLVVGLVIALLVLGLVNVAAYAQGVTNLREYTGYQVMNLATCAGCNANVRVDYYGPGGGTPVLSKNLDPIPPGGSVNVQQKTEAGLPDGVYSAVLSADQPIAAVVGQIEADPSAPGLGTYYAPFSDYTGASAGSKTVVLPELMNNWFGIDSLVRLQNAGDGPATVSIQYYASKLGNDLAGRPSIPVQTQTVQKFAAVTIDQSQLGGLLAATSGPFTGQFLGSAVITSDQPLVAVVNQTAPAARQKFTYNGFGTDDSGTDVLAPAIFWNWYNTFTSLSVQNTSTSAPVNVTITYTAGPGSLLTNGSNGSGQTVVKTITLGPGESTTRYEGGNGSQSDLKGTFSQFGGSARVTATGGNVVAKVNQTQYQAVSDQLPSGSYNGVPVNRLTTSVAAPLIQADFYTYFTSLTCANASTTTDANITIKYTSDNLSAKPNQSTTVNHTITKGGSIIVYEAQRNGALADINRAGGFFDVGGTARFNGSAFINSTNGTPIACTVNEVGGGTTGDNMNTYNAVSLQP